MVRVLLVLLVLLCCLCRSCAACAARSSRVRARAHAALISALRHHVRHRQPHVAYHHRSGPLHRAAALPFLRLRRPQLPRAAAFQGQNGVVRHAVVVRRRSRGPERLLDYCERQEFQMGLGHCGGKRAVEAAEAVDDAAAGAAQAQAGQGADGAGAGGAADAADAGGAGASAGAADAHKDDTRRWTSCSSRSWISKRK